MTPSQIEAWALDVIARVGRGGPLEDSRVELKAKWIDADKAARRVAGHANAAGGEPILWLFGVDEVGGVMGVPTEDLASWIPKLQAHFDGTSPSVTDVIVSTPHGDVVAMKFDTGNAPYVTKVQAGGADREVPWREATRVRSATRAELLRILHPYARVPVIELISAHAFSRRSHVGPGEHDYGTEIKFVLDLYVVPLDGQRIVIPRHKCRCRVTVSESLQPYAGARLLPPKLPQNPVSSYVKGIRSEERAFPDSPLVTFTANEAIFDGPGQMCCEWELHGPDSLSVEKFDAEFDFCSVRSPAPAIVSCTFYLGETSRDQDFWSAHGAT